MSWTKKFAIIFVVLATLVGLYDLVNWTNTAHGDASKGQTIQVVNASPVSLVGTWHQTSGMNGVTMTAEITAGGIQINMQLGKTNGIFWLGDFDTSDDTTQSFEVYSKGDQDAMALDIFASSETGKTFTYKNGDLSYEFSMLGMESTVHLSKD